MKLKEIAGGNFGGRRRNNPFCSLSGVTNHDSAACASWRTRAAAAQTELYLEVILIWKSEWRGGFFASDLWQSVLWATEIKHAGKGKRSVESVTRHNEEHSNDDCWEGGLGGWWGGSPQPWQTGILNRHPPRDGSQLHGGATPLTIHGDGTCANAGGPSPCLPACLMKGKWAPEHRGKRKEAFCRIKITPSDCRCNFWKRAPEYSIRWF